MRCVPYQDLSVGQEFKLEESSWLVLVKQREVSSSLPANPHDAFEQMVLDAIQSPAPLMVWIE